MNEGKPERRGLGRGLSALLSDVAQDSGAQDLRSHRRPDGFVAIELISPNPNQPRRDFEASALAELADSIKAKGIIQPLIVRPKPPSGYEIVAGERRWRAAQMAHIHEIPVLIRDFTDTEVLEVAIIENIQRSDLNAVEEALSYRQLMDRFGHTQERLAEALGKSRSHIANLLRLLNLPDDVLAHVRSGSLSAGHARALVTTPDPARLARQVIARGLNVRQTEVLAQDEQRKIPGHSRRSNPKEKDADTRALESDLTLNLGMAVRIDHEPGGNSGILSIRYTTLDDLDLLCRGLSVLPRDGSV